MAEPDIDVREAVQAVQGVQAEELESSEEGELSEVELEAVDLGWNPEGVEGKRNLSPEEFIDRQSFYDEIKHLKRQVKQTNNVVDALKTHNDTIAERSYEKAIQDLKAQKKVAAADEDLGAVIAIDDQIDAVKEEQAASKANTVQETVTKDDWDTSFNTFTDQNIWYGRVPEMTQRADVLGRTYMASATNPTPEECYQYVQKHIKADFPEEFGAAKQSRRAKPAAVASPQGGAKPAARTKKHSLSELDTATRKIAETLISSGTITEEKYLKDYFSE